MAKPLRKTHRTNSRNCIAILTLTFAASINPLFAQTSKISMDLQNSRAQIGALEVKILGKEFQTDSDITRIRRLEHLVFPKDKPNSKWPLEQRIAKVLTIVTGQENSIREGSSMERHFLERRKELFKTNSTSLLQQSKPVGAWEHKTPTLLNATSEDNKADVVLILLDCSNSMKSYLPSGFTT